MEVGNLSDRIGVLQEKFESVSELAEPKENSYLVYELVEANSNNRFEFQVAGSIYQSLKFIWFSFTEIVWSSNWSN